MRRGKTLLCLSLILVTAVLLTGCGKKPPKDETPATPVQLAGRTYTWEKEGFGGDFTIRLDEDGTFTYYEGFLSSYIGLGRWELSGDRLTLTEASTWSRLNEDGKAESFAGTQCFRVDGDGLVFVTEGSDNFLYCKVTDGDRFLSGPDNTEN